MTIVYISRLFGCPWAGPTYSIPSQVKAQSKIDKVLWYNLVHEASSEWSESIKEWKKEVYYCDLDQFPNEKIQELPEPFNQPDIVVVEQFYKFAKNKIVHNLINGGFKYVIIPRGELTKEAQSQKALKKKIFNFVYFNKFARNAAAVQYLTCKEKENCEGMWNSKSLIIPNGTKVPDKIKRENPHGSIVIVSVGRINVFHKGIDLLIDACSSVNKLLHDKNVFIKLYGPDENGAVTDLQAKLANENLSDIISFEGPIRGNDKVEVLQAADAFIMTSRFEGHPTGLLEALSYGLPALVTNGSNMRDEVVAFDAGWGADNEPASIAEAIKNMLVDTNSFVQKGDNAYNLSQKYSWDAIAKRSHDEYASLIQE